jgi:hypothetical protein
VKRWLSFIFIRVSVLAGTMKGPAVGSTQPPIQRVPGSLSLEVNQQQRESDHSPPSSSEVNNAWKIGFLGFDSRRGLGIFLFTSASRTALRSTQPPIQWVPVGLSLGVNRPGREADHSPPSSAEFKECVELYLHPNTSSWRGAQLKLRDNFIFSFLYLLLLHLMGI